ncbi:MAG: indole-3-glycerol phosphate synthase TrpC [Phycisphaerales bacterium]|nr:indole-3-glycerol phosphate synthase TrpC [Phycisphaerales bacterium]
MPPTLQEILDATRAEVARRKQDTSVEALRDRVAGQSAPRNFFAAVATGQGPGGVNVIAELKRQSPSAGAIRADMDPIAIALQYEQAGAVALSVLTDERWFGGSLEDLAMIRDAVRLPVLRKDFMVDAWQIWEARAAGADAILLIAEALPEGQVVDMLILAQELGMTALVEVHDVENLLMIRRHVGFPHPGYMLLGINNRNLATMKTDVSHGLRMAELVEEHLDILVAESGISTRADIDRFRRRGIHRFLIGESLLTADDPGLALRSLLGTPWN